MPVVRHQLQVVGGAGAPATVTISRHPHSFTSAHAEVMKELTLTVGPAGNPAWSAGYFEADLPSESAYVTAGYYRLKEPGGGSHTFLVPETVGPHWLDTIVTAVAPAAGAVLPVLFSALRDTTALSGATNGQVPVWNSATGKWVPGAGGGPHAATHATGGTDPVSPASIGAAGAGHNHDGTYAVAGHTHAGARLSLADQMGVAAVTQDPSLITSAAVGLTSGTLYGCSAILPAGRTLTHVLVGLRQNGATPTGVSKLGVLAADGNRLGLTADSATLWTTGETTARELALTATIAAHATDDRLIYLVMLSTCSTPPQVYLGQLLTNSMLNPNPSAGRRSWVLAGQADIPASVDLGTVALNSGVFQLYAR